MPKIVADDVVFDAVVTVIVAQGYGGATTKSIAELADVNEATLFRKYGSKDQLVLKALNYLTNKIDITSLVYYTGDVQVDLLRILEVLFKSDDTEGDLFLVLISEVHRYPELKSLMSVPLNMLRQLGQLFARYQADGVLRQEHPLQAVLAFMAPLGMSRRLHAIGDVAGLPKIDPVGYVNGYLHGRMLT